MVYTLNILTETFSFLPETKNENSIYYAADGELGAMG